MIRTIDVGEITEHIRQMCIETNHRLSEDMNLSLKQAAETETSELGKKILDQLLLNLEIAKEDNIPICQDTGMAVIFLEIGQDVHFTGGLLEDAVNQGVKKGYEEGYLRKSVVGDPILRRVFEKIRGRRSNLKREYKGQYPRGNPLFNCIRRQSENYICSKRVWKRKYEPHFYVKACGRT